MRRTSANSPFLGEWKAWSLRTAHRERGMRQVLKVRLDVHHAANLSELDEAFAAIGGSGSRALGLKVPQSVLLRADRVVE